MWACVKGNGQACLWRKKGWEWTSSVCWRFNWSEQASVWGFGFLMCWCFVEQSGLEPGWGELKIFLMEQLKFALVLQHSCKVGRATRLFTCVVCGRFVSILVAAGISLN